MSKNEHRIPLTITKDGKTPHLITVHFGTPNVGGCSVVGGRTFYDHDQEQYIRSKAFSDLRPGEAFDAVLIVGEVKYP